MALTQKDIDKIKGIVKDIIIVNNIGLEELLEDKFKKIFLTEERFAEFRNELYEKLDEILIEVQASREERVVIGHRLSNHEDRVTALEEIHPAGQHP